MQIGTSLIPEFDMEMANTRKVLERVPDDKLQWRAHPKSNTIGWNANHLAELPGWVPLTLNLSELDIAPPDGPAYQSPAFTTSAEIVQLFDDNVAQARAQLIAADDSVFTEPWKLLKGGMTIMTMPKLVVIRSFVMNHSIHHRAILSVYLRLNDIPVPGLYGPSGDEGWN